MPGPKSKLTPEERKRKRADDALRCYYRHREKYKAASNERRRKHRLENREACLERDRAYFRANGARIRETARLRAAADREAFNSYQREWNAKNPELSKAHAASNHHKRRKWMVESLIPPTSKQIKELFSQFHSCVYCNLPFNSERRKTLDHIIPRALNGVHELSNCTVACKSCNSSKNDCDPQEYTRRIGLLLLI